MRVKDAATQAGARIEIALDARESAALADMCASSALTPERLLRHALRHYQAYLRHLARGGAPLPSPSPSKLPPPSDRPAR